MPLPRTVGSEWSEFILVASSSAARDSAWRQLTILGFRQPSSGTRENGDWRRKIGYFNWRHVVIEGKRLFMRLIDNGPFTPLIFLGVSLKGFLLVPLVSFSLQRIHQTKEIVLCSFSLDFPTSLAKFSTSTSSRNFVYVCFPSSTNFVDFFFAFLFSFPSLKAEDFVLVSKQ